MANKIGDKLLHRFNITYTFTFTETKSANFAIPEIMRQYLPCPLCANYV